MAENGQFRSKFGGFNKDDVLEYIDSLQEQHVREMDSLRAQSNAERAAYEKALNDANQELARQFDQLKQERSEQEKLQQLIGEQYNAMRDLRVQSTDTTGVREEVKTLREQLDAEKKKYEEFSVQRQSACETTEKRAQELQNELMNIMDENARLSAENEQYRKLIGNVGNFVAEVRAMGQRYLDDANDRCSARLSVISRMIEDLNGELTAAADELDDAERNRYEQASHVSEQLDALMREMECSTAGMPEDVTEAGTTAQFF